MKSSREEIHRGFMEYAHSFRQNRYYDGMLYLMSLMHLSGEFRNQMPQ